MMKNLWNTMIETETYTQDKKCRKIIPILKPGKQITDPTSYIPVNLLSSISNIEYRNGRTNSEVFRR